jgi:hypothetical protein
VRKSNRSANRVAAVDHRRSFCGYAVTVAWFWFWVVIDLGMLALDAALWVLAIA